MSTATLTSKGQPTIPFAVRVALNVNVGDPVGFVDLAPGRDEFIAATVPVTVLRGMFGRPRTVVSVEQINSAIAQRGAVAANLTEPAADPTEPAADPTKPAAK